MEEIEINYCENITTLEPILKHCKNLKRLFFYNVKVLNDEEGKSVCELKELEFLGLGFWRIKKGFYDQMCKQENKFLKLKTLILQDSINLTDDSFIKLIDGLRLDALDLTDCKRIGPKSLSFLSESSSSQTLKSLKISGVVFAEKECFEKLSNCSNLQKIWFPKQISEDSLFQFLQKEKKKFLF